ncbi:hypothetical protein Gorai_005322 [Gossypium raimondii]|uniref:Uncharacterized protein n=1 Tax=Gossypium raimondii TaxID=29730 RepID=A0A7J8QBX4_GOSRA|nr:hypothetical protein [Gossypium raimondii]
MLLGRLYYEKGGKSQWLATLMQLAGFPYSHSYYCFSSLKNSDCNQFWHSSPTIHPGSRVDLCLHWPTCSNILLSLLDGVVIPSHSSTPNGVSRGKSVIGFICTIVASAGNGLYLSLTHFCFQKVIKRESFYQSLVASSAIMLGLFVTGEWKSLKGEMEEHELGKTSYIMALVWMCILWQGVTIGRCYSDPSCYLSHVYQHYLDDRESKSEHTNINVNNEA